MRKYDHEEFSKMTAAQADAVISNKDVTPMELRDLVEWCPHITAKHLERIWDRSEDTFVYKTAKYSVLNHRLVTPRILTDAIKESEWVLRSAASRSPKLPLKTALSLLGDPERMVRENVLSRLANYVEAALQKFLA